MASLRTPGTLGAQLQRDGRTRFRVWASARQRVDIAVEEADEPGGLRYLPLTRAADGYFEGIHPVAAGSQYRLRLDGGDAFPDPCSRYQPEGPHGPSVVVDPAAFKWTDGEWKGLSLRGQVLYELHVGAFTPEGTYAALMRELPALRDLGVTAVQLLPVNTFPGRFNWGYDGVGLFSPCAVYGTPDELKALINEAHRLGLGMILDVVYNHFGPDGSYFRRFSPAYFCERYKNEWGECINFDGEHSEPVRDFFLQNAAQWISEYHFDGLRVDATQTLFDSSTPHISAEIASVARAAAGDRTILMIGENEPQDGRYVKPPEQAGYGYDALWIDDFHHTVRVALTGRNEAYCQDYRGTAQEVLSAIRYNSLYQGQWYAWQKKPRGTPLHHLPAPQFTFFLQNHDQVANMQLGHRFQEVAGKQRARAFTTLLLLAPQTPMLFMGQEYFASSPFLYFTDHGPELQEAVRTGRTEFLKQFPSTRRALKEEGYDLPIGRQAFASSKLDPAERARNGDTLLFHKELLALRRTDPVFAAQDGRMVEGAVLSDSALALRFFGAGGGDRLLLVNWGVDLHFEPCPEPLLAPIPGGLWEPVLSSEETRFGGTGAVFPTGEGPWLVAGSSATVLRSPFSDD